MAVNYKGSPSRETITPEDGICSQRCNELAFEAVLLLLGLQIID